MRRTLGFQAKPLGADSTRQSCANTPIAVPADLEIRLARTPNVDLGEHRFHEDGIRHSDEAPRQVRGDQLCEQLAATSVNTCENA